MYDILQSLNKQQRQAVTTTEGYVRVVAGAGTGKTKALTHRYAYLVRELGISAQHILCLTFTNKAAREMKTRIKYLLGADFDTSFVATIHSFCTRVLREDIGRLFYPESFIVLDVSDQKKILEEVYDELNIRMDTASFQFMIDKIKYYKNLLTYCDYVLQPANDISEVKPRDNEENIILRYIMKQKKYFGLDFFDLINFTIYLFNTHPDTLEKWQKRLHYVMVDEFQDITAKEYKLIKRLTDARKNWFVVGDPDQNIYEWRGSRIHILMDFDQNLPGTQDILLSENYRSTPEILDAANALIEKNKQRIPKVLYTKTGQCIKPEHFHTKNEAEEMTHITGIIKQYADEGGRYSDMAVLYRSAHVSRFVEQGLLKANIPYVVYGGVGFYERMEVKDVLSYLRLVAFGDDLSFKRIVNVPRRKFGKTKMAYLENKAAQSGQSLYACLRDGAGDPIYKGTGAAAFVAVIEHIRTLTETQPVSEVLQRLLINAEYERYIRESGDMERLDNISELVRSIVQIENDYGETLTLATFLQDISLHREDASEPPQDAVRIMTMHSAKGLEFPVVFMAGMSDGVIPSARSMEERKNDALEEERRLCFVGMTRAKRRLYMSDSEGYGVRGVRKLPSRFLFDIDDALIDRIGDVQSMREELLFEIKHEAAATKARMAAGTHVKHKVFGEGIIEAADEETKTYTVRFVNGDKPIHFDYEGLWEI